MQDIITLQALSWIVAGEAMALIVLAWLVRRTSHRAAIALNDARHELECDYRFLETRMNARSVVALPLPFNASDFKDFKLQMRSQLTRIERKIDQGDTSHAESIETDCRDQIFERKFK